MTIPAYNTKHLSHLSITLNGFTYRLKQSNTSNETGSTLWLSSQILSAYLALHPSKLSRNKKVTLLELGSGIGLTSLVCHDLGYQVTASDYGAIVPLLEQNIQLNGKKEDVTIETIDWCRCDHMSRIYDVVILADVIYAPELLDPLVNTMLRAVNKKSTIYVAQEVRSPHLMQRFLDICSRSFKIQTVNEEEIARVVQTHLRSTETQGMQDELSEEEEDWSGVAIYKMRLKSMVEATLS